MGSFTVENLSFTYPNRQKKALHGVTFSAEQGEFILLCGKSGSGKTTLLRMLKPILAPFGRVEGSVFFDGMPLSSYKTCEQAATIGFVMQSCDNQLVTDKVWHELAFGLENLGLNAAEIRERVSEMATFFGIESWFHQSVSTLSGGQKQLLNLASVMVMNPSVILLDEPTSQLDPIAAQNFLKMLEKINRELGTTVIMTEHRLDDVFHMADRVLVVDDGRLIIDDAPKQVCAQLKEMHHEMYDALPVPVRIYGAVETMQDYPITVRKGRNWLESLEKKDMLFPDKIPPITSNENAENAVVEMKDVWFRYKKDLPDVIRGLNLKVFKGELMALVGGNGTGKTTILSLIAALHTPYRGGVFINGETILKQEKLYDGVLGYLPQNPQSVFTQKMVYLDLMDAFCNNKGIAIEEKEEKIKEIAVICHVEHLLFSHPYDLSGGEQQRVALAKVLLKTPEILLLDEPTKGMDAQFKSEFAEILRELKMHGVTIIMVSHDVEFCAEFADRCALLFDGEITSVGEPRAFFAGKNFYTTSASRMARTTLPQAILAEDVILACGGTIPEKTRQKRHIPPFIFKKGAEQEEKKKQGKKRSPIRLISGFLFAFLYLLLSSFYIMDAGCIQTLKNSLGGSTALQVAGVLLIGLALFCFFPKRKKDGQVAISMKPKKKLTKSALFLYVFSFIAILLTIGFGGRFLGNRKYYIISLLMIAEAIIPFWLCFERRKPQARELVMMSVLCGIIVFSRTAFFMLPQFKPVVALVIIVGVCFGGETGFLTGTMVAFASNMFFGQGPWTPWQMLALAVVGFLAGILFRNKGGKTNEFLLCLFGFAATFVIYGGIMNASTVIQTQVHLNLNMFIVAFMSGVPFDLVHATSTAFFLWFLASPMIEELMRIKTKYGMLDR